MSKPEPDFAMDELLDELLTTPQDDEGWRVVELAAVSGLSERTIRRRMVKLWREGRLVRGRRYIEDMAGRRVPVAVYRLRREGEKG